MSQDLYNIDKDVRSKVCKIFETTPEQVDHDVKLISEWLKTQSHLPEVMEDVKIRNFLIMCKFSIEKTKQKIDMYYTIRSLIPDRFEKSNPKLPCMKRLTERSINAIHPVAVDGLYRVYFFQMLEPNAYVFREQSKQFFNIFEIRLYEDCMVGDILVVDMTNITISDLKKVTPSVLAEGFIIYQKVYSQRMKAMYLVNAPSYANIALKLLKMVLKPKIFERIHVCQDAKILSEILNEDNLPKDYGGNGPSLKQLNEMMKLKMEQYQDRFDRLDELRVNESLRPGKLNNDDILGYYGNFKQLNVD